MLFFAVVFVAPSLISGDTITCPPGTSVNPVLYQAYLNMSTYDQRCRLPPAANVVCLQPGFSPGAINMTEDRCSTRDKWPGWFFAAASFAAGAADIGRGIYRWGF